MTINLHSSKASGKPRGTRERILALGIAFVATLFAAPGHAVNIPSVPLQTGSAYPLANVLFILDDSGSMKGVAMPGDVHDPDPNYPDHQVISSWAEFDPANIRHASYGHNTIYYNPATVYQSWMTAEGSRLTGGKSYDAVYKNPANLTDTVDLSDTVQTFYVPKSAAVATSTNFSDFYRYQIRYVSGTLRVVRSEWARLRDPEGQNNAGCADQSSSNTLTWRNCTFATPAGRSVADELVNFATWYSYHRSRMKVAKAGASEAFNYVGDNLRVGFDTINRGGNLEEPRFAIPVGTDNGLFKGANKASWYEYLQSSNALGGTPLQRALYRAGKYYERSDAAGPWGPETAASQISCRQNFTVLTTDGFWNTSTVDVGDADGTAGPTITNSDGRTYTYQVARPYYDNFVETSIRSRSRTLADVAMDNWKRDLRVDLENNVPDSPANPAFWQHTVTFGVSIGLKGRLDPEVDLPAITNGSKNWPDPTNAEDADRIDDLWHAAVNGRGDFLVASNTKEFAQGLLEAFKVVAQRLGSASNVTANSTSFRSDTRVYQASYVSGKWSGELAAYDASRAGVSATPAWRASTLIPTSGRNIFTWNGTGGSTFPTSAQTSLLDASSRLTAPVTGANNAAYIAGTRTLERQNGGELRDRDTVLGDIVNSSPMYIKDSETIFAGANDGMLHAFNALTGAERFAYVPGGINFADLRSLSDPQYSHKYFVDGPIVVTTREQAGGNNYLVGSLGRGGKGLFALDVTDPTRFGASDVMWELTSGANLGQVLGEPLIVTLNGGTKAVVFGNGINSASGSAVLYVVNLTTGVVMQEINTGVAGDNGLFAPRGRDIDQNGTVDYIYAGDLKGNLWKFDFTSSVGSIAHTGRPMFTTPNGQPITAGLAIGREPAPGGKRWVFVGTGSFMTSADLTDSSIQSVYGLIDDGSEVTITELQSRDIVAVTSVNGRLQRAFEPHDDLPDGKKGWYLDLDNPTPGERVVSRVQMEGTVLRFASLIPPTDDTCEAGGQGFINAIDAFTGTSLEQAYFDGNGDGIVDEQDAITHNGSPVPIGSVDLGVGMPTLPTVIDELLVVGGSKGNMGQVAVKPQLGQPVRISWREILRD